MTNKIDGAVIEPKITADASIIWLHGLGADASDFTGIVNQLGLPEDHRVRFIFPNAPLINVTVNHGMKMRGWYDIFDLNLLRKEDELGITQSNDLLTSIIKHEVDGGIDSKRIILAGFSQGGAMSLYTGLRYTLPLAGIIVLSGYMPLAASFNPAKLPHNRDTQVFMAHGLFDPVVPLHAGKTTAQQLSDNHYNVELKTYAMSHTVINPEITDIGKFICRCLGYDQNISN